MNKKLLMTLALTLCAGAKAQTIDLRTAAVKPLRHTWSTGVCAGRVNEGLRASWQEQLQTVQDHCHFKYLRMHALFDDDMCVYFEHGNRAVYSWQYVDDVYDRMLTKGIRPFVELSFFPKGIAADTSKLQMWYRNRVTPDRSRYPKWHDLVKAFCEHVVNRYGIDEVSRWYFEVWNEPNLDFGFFDNKLTGTLNYYYNATSDLLIYKELAPSVGLSSPILNVGKIRNTGIEMEINWNQKIREFEYNAGVNLSTVNNKVKELSDQKQVLYGEGLKYGSEHFPTQTRVGKPIGAFYLYQADGLFQSIDEVKNHVNKSGEMLQPNAQPGDLRFVDVNGDGTIDEEDKVYSGSGIPKLEANLNFSCAWKGLDLAFTLSSAFNFKLYNGNKYFYEGMSSGSNFLKSTLDAWTPTHTGTAVPRAVYQDPNNNTRESTRFLENGDFLRMRQLQIGYTLPRPLSTKIQMEKIRFYLSAENLFTITGYDGIDPEFSRGVLNTGIDNLIFPFTRSVTVGAQLTF